MRRRSLLLALSAFLLHLPIAWAADAPFSFSGVLSSLLPKGAEAAPNRSGLPFEVKLSANGQKVEGTAFTLTVPGAPKPFRLTLDAAAFAAGQLTAKATIGNGSGAALEGLRLDLAEATETYSRTNAEGKVVYETRTQKVSAAPLHFGDLANGETSDALPWVATGIAFNPETTQIVVRGVVSGLRYEKTIVHPTACGSGQIEIDERGNLYLSDICNQRIARLTPKGEISGFELPADAKGMARDPASGRLAGTYRNTAEIRLIGAEGQVLGTLGEVQGLDTFPDFLRFDNRGKLWAEASGSIVRFGPTGQLEQRIRSIGRADLFGALAFDIASDGTLWLIFDGGLWRLPADGEQGARLVVPGLKPGELTAPEAPRVAPDGTIWVVEGADPTHKAAERVSVFDREGRLIRVFGRAARAPLPTFPSAYHEAQIYRARDLAFGPESRVYIAAQRPGIKGEHVMVFRRF